MTDYDGLFVWYDLMTTDPEGAQAFYKEVIGWETENWDKGPYTMWKAGDTTVGGVNQLAEEAQKSGAPSHWLGYVGTSDLAASFEKMQDAGGKVLYPPTEIPSVGHFGIFADPGGATIAMFQPGGDTPPPPSGPGCFSWHEYMASDLDAAVAWYESLFGWEKKEAMDMGPAGLYQMYGMGERTLGGMMKKPEAMPGPPSWLYYIKIGDMSAALEKAKALGGTVINGPMEVPGGDHVAQLLDPQGAAFSLHELAKKS